MENRINRINDELKRELSYIISNELSDPRLKVLTSVSKVDTSKDLKHCKVHISVFGNETEKKEAMEALTSANGYIRKLIASKLNLRNTPSLKFINDESLEESFRIFKLIDEAVKNEKSEQNE